MFAGCVASIAVPLQAVACGRVERECHRRFVDRESKRVLSEIDLPVDVYVVPASLREQR